MACSLFAAMSERRHSDFFEILVRQIAENGKVDFISAKHWAYCPRPSLSLSGTYTVSSSVDETVYGLTTATGATLDVTGGVFTIRPSWHHKGH
jgi:hypothetical protein